MSLRLSTSTSLARRRAEALGFLAGAMIGGVFCPPIASASAAAKTQPTFALTAVPAGGVLRFHTSRGHTVGGAFTLRNTTARRIVVRIQSADIRNAANGNADYITAGKQAAGRWLRLTARNVRLEPRATRLIDFRVRVPRAADRGSHYAGIVAFDTADLRKHPVSKASGQTSSFSFARISRQALPITVRLPGPRSRSLALRTVAMPVDSAGLSLDLGLRPGGTILTSSAQVRLRITRGGRTVFRHTATLGQLFPGSSLQYRVPWRGRATPGTYRVTGVIEPAGAAPLRIDRSVAFTNTAAAAQERVAPATANVVSHSAAQIPAWVWITLAVCLLLLLALAAAVARLGLRGRSDLNTARR